MRISDWSSDVCSSDLLAEEALHRLIDLRHAGHAADHDDVVDLARRHTGILQRSLHRGHGALDEVVHQGFQLGAGQLDVEVLRPGRIGSDERQVDLGLCRRRQLDLRLFRLFLQRSEEHTSELPSLMRISYAVFRLTKKKTYLKT